MLYLAWQHLWFVVAAAGCGVVIGWLTASRRTTHPRSGWLIVLALLWLVGLAVTLTRLLNGWPAQWLETGLIYLAAYAAGCWLGQLSFHALAADRPALPAPPPMLALPAPAPVEPANETQPGPEEPEIALPRVASLPTLVATAPADRPQAPSGERPPELPAPRDGAADDLKRIKGIGRGNEERLRGIGIWHLDQIAAWTPAHAEWVGGYLAFPGRIEREDWVGQARALTGQSNPAPPAPETVAAPALPPAVMLAEPREGGPDRLTLLGGIGPGLADRLNRSGIWHFDQIAGLREPELRDLAQSLGADAALAARWREDADILAHGGETAHSRAVKSGRVTPRD